MNSELKNINDARDYIQSKTDLIPQVAIILGSGLGELVEDVEINATIPYEEIPGFSPPTVSGHGGNLVLGVLAGKKVVIMQGRYHYYEGYSIRKVVFPILVLKSLGANTLIVTNAAGGLNPDFNPGDVMLITDHINVQGTNALIGPNLDEFGPRFPDMTYTYTPDLQKMALAVANKEGITLRQGVYAAWSGPTYETPAERRFLRIIGGDAVGMSTVPEVTVANHTGMRILGFSAITNIATGESDQPPDSHEHVLKMAKIAGEDLIRLVYGSVSALTFE